MFVLNDLANRAETLLNKLDQSAAEKLASGGSDAADQVDFSSGTNVGEDLKKDVRVNGLKTRTVSIPPFPRHHGPTTIPPPSTTAYSSMSSVILARSKRLYSPTARRAPPAPVPSNLDPLQTAPKAVPSTRIKRITMP